MAPRIGVGVVVLAVLVSLGPPVPAVGGDRGVLALDQALRDLASDLRAAMVVVSPGDEDLETLALLRRRHGVDTELVAIGHQWL